MSKVIQEAPLLLPRNKRPIVTFRKGDDFFFRDASTDILYGPFESEEIMKNRLLLFTGWRGVQFVKKSPVPTFN